MPSVLKDKSRFDSIDCGPELVSGHPGTSSEAPAKLSASLAQASIERGAQKAT
jgi:hypothetical protein